MTDDMFLPSFADHDPMTPRTRYVLWLAAATLADGLEVDVRRLRADHPSFATDYLLDFPTFAHLQPFEWWDEVCAGAWRLTEAFRTGVQWNPRTPGEEACLYMLTHRGIANETYDSIHANFEDHDLFEDLEDREDQDYAWDSVLGALTGDGDVAWLWSSAPGAAGIEDPNHAINMLMAMADYRPEKWNYPFPMYQQHADQPSRILA